MGVGSVGEGGGSSESVGSCDPRAERERGVARETEDGGEREMEGVEG